MEQNKQRYKSYLLHRETQKTDNIQVKRVIAIMPKGRWHTGEIPEAHWRDIPNFNPPQKIVKNYTPDQEGQDICPQDVVRPVNHIWAKASKVVTWKELSRERAPTYGSCTLCFKSGPIGGPCSECNYPDKNYVVLNYDDMRGHRAVLNSITMAKIFRVGHETAKADHDILWL